MVYWRPYTRRRTFHVKHEPYNPTADARISATRYRGKVCEKHPEDQGERHVRTFLCCSCVAQKKRDYRADRSWNKDGTKP